MMFGNDVLTQMTLFNHEMDVTLSLSVLSNDVKLMVSVRLQRAPYNYKVMFSSLQS